MAYSSLGPKQEPEFADGDAPDVAVNPSQVAKYAARFGNKTTGTTAERGTASAWAWENLLWKDTTDGIEYLRTGGAWKAWNSGWITYTPTLTNITLGAGGTAAFAYQYANGDVKLKWLVTLGTGGTWNSPSFSVPVTMNNGHLALFSKVGWGSLQSFSQFWELLANRVSATEIRMYVAGGSPLTFTVVSPTVPVAVSAGLNLSGRAEYTPA